MPAHKLGEVLAQSGELSAFSRQARRLAELQQVLLEAVPTPLAKSTRVKSLRAGTLFLLADNSAVAAKLRQLAPTLLLHVRKREIEVTGIQVEVQVAAQQPGSSGTQSGRDLSLTAVNTLDGLAEALNESPLKTALTRLVRRRKGVKKGTGA